MNIFHVNENLKTYTYPILKIIICVILILIAIYRGHIFHVDNKVLDIGVSIICTAVGFMCILCIYISVAELILTYENREKTVLSDNIITNSKQYAIDEVIFMAEKNDIIDIKIVSENGIVGIGASSDCKNGSSKFFDKLYYIDDEVFEEIKDFKSKLLLYAINGKILVISIDGIAMN